MDPDSEQTNYVVVQCPARRQWLCFRKPIKIFTTKTVSEISQLLKDVENEVKNNNCYAAGFLGYEAAPAFDRVYPAKPAGDVPLAWFGIYQEFEPLDPADLKLDPTFENQSMDWALLMEENEYRQSLQKIKNYIEQGDTYQVNYSFRMRTKYDQGSWPFFVQMVHAQNLVDQWGYCAYVQTDDWVVCSASPELFFEYQGRKLTSKPMKGTAPRGLGNTDDLEAGQALQASIKNRAENIMIADMVRNDMGRIADIGTVETTSLLDLEKYPTFWTMTTTVQCQTDPELVKIFEALFPAASITGAPKLRAMEIIDELEALPRHVYTGTTGFVAPDDTAQFNVAIRTVMIDKANHQAEFGVGGGIVWDSETGDEFEECHTKARVLTYSQPEFDLIETFKWDVVTGYCFLDQHIDRITNSVAYFSWLIDAEEIESRLKQAETDFPKTNQRVRLQLSKSGKVRIQNTELVALPSPYHVRVALKPVSSKNYFLYHKTTYRAMYDKALSSVADCDDALLWNEKGELTESCRANILIETPGGWLTPPISCGLLNGIGRQDLLDRGEVSEAIIDIDQLLSAKSIWLINSVREKWPVELLHN